MASFYDNKYRKRIEEQQRRKYYTETAEDLILEQHNTNRREMKRDISKDISGTAKSFYKDMLEDGRKAIAPFLNSKLNDTAASMSTTYYMQLEFMKNGHTFKNQNTLADDEIAKTFANGSINLDNIFGAKANSIFIGNRPSFAYNHQEISSTQNRAGIFDGIRNIESHGGVSYIYDFETLGGKKLRGRTQGYPITEFSFAKVTGNLKGSTFIENEKDKNRIVYHNSVIGSTDEEFDQQMSIIKKYTTNAADMTEDEMVTLERLALMGRSELDKDNMTKDGLIAYKKFADKSELGGILNAEDMVKGAQDLHWVGQWQHGLGQVEYMGEKMYGWERSYLTALSDIYKNDYTVVSHNGTGFDNPNARIMAMSEKMSAGAKKALFQVTGGHSIYFKHQVDTLQAVREFVTERFGMFDKETLKAMKEKELSTGQQESLLLSYALDYFDNDTAHNAKSDTIGAATALYKTGLFNPNSKKFILGRDYTGKNTPMAARKIPMNGKHVFYVENNTSAASNRLMVFNHDALGGEWRTGEGLAINPKGVRKQLFGQAGYQKNTLVTMVNSGEISKDNPLYKQIVKINPDLDIGSLHFIQYHTLSDNPTMKSVSDNFYVGSYEDLQNHINKNLRHAYDIDSNGNPTMKNVRKEDKEALALYKIRNGKVKVTEATPENLLYESTMRVKNEAAARATRMRSYKKDAALIGYIDAMDAEVAQKLPADATEAEKEKVRQEFRDRVKTKSWAMQHKMEAGERIGTEEAEGTWQKFFGWKNKDAGWDWTAYTETINAAVNREKEVRANYYLIKSTLKAADADSHGDVNTRNAVYRARRHYIEDYSIARDMDEVGNPRHPEKQGMKNLGIRGEVFKHFRVDLSGMGSLPGYKPAIANFSMNSSGYGISSTLQKILGNDITKKDATSQLIDLKRLQTHLVTELGMHMRSDGSNTIGVNETVDSAGQKIISMFNDEREKNAYAGLPKDSLRHVVTNTSIKNYGLSEKEIDKLNSDFQSPTYKVISGKGISAENIASEIVEKHLVDKTPSVDELKAAGYSERDIKRIEDMYARHKQGVAKILTPIIEGAKYNGKGIVVDGNRIGIMNSSGEVHEIFAPEERFVDGIMAGNIGESKQRISTPIGIYRKKNGKFFLGSIYEKAADEYGSMLTAMSKKDARTGSSFEDSVDYYLSKINAVIRGNAATPNEDAYDARLVGQFDVNEAISNIGLLDTVLDKEKLSDGDKEIWNKLFVYATENPDKETNFKDLYYAQQAVIARNQDVFKEAFGKLIDDGTYGTLYQSSLDLSVKHGKDAKGNVFEDAEIAFEGNNARSRYIGEVITKALRFDAADVTPELVSRGAVAGTSIMTKFEAPRAANTHLMTNRLTISSVDYHKMISNAIKDGVIASDSYSARALTGMNLNEGSSIMSSYLTDGPMQHSAYKQSIAFKDVADTIEQLKVLTNNREINISFHGAANGKIYAEQGEGKFFLRDSPLLYKKGYQKPEVVTAQEDGFLTLNYHDQGNKIISKEQLVAIVNGDKDITKLNPAMKGFDEQVKEILEKKYRFKLKFDLMSATVKTNVKLGDYREKNMGSSTIASLGSVDKKIKEIILKLHAPQLLDHTQTKEVVESLLDDSKAIGNTYFGKMIIGYAQANGHTIGNRDIDVELAGIGGRKGFYNAIVNERHSVQKDLDKIVEREFGVSTKFDFIDNTAKPLEKHLDADRVKELAADLMHFKNYSAEKTAGIIKRIANVEYDKKTGGIIDLKGDINYNEYEKVMQEEFYDKNGNNVLMHSGKSGTKAQVGRADLSMLVNLDKLRIRANGKGQGSEVKANARYVNALLVHQMDSTLKSQVEKKLSGAVGHGLGEGLYKSYIEGYSDGEVILDPFIRQLKQNRFESPGKAHIWYNDDIYNDMGDKEQKYATREMHEQRDILIGSGITDKQIDMIIDSAKKRGAKGLTADYVSLTQTAVSHGIASDFNTGKSGYGIKDLEKMGFSRETLGTIHTAADTIDESVHALSGRQIYMDLADENLEKAGIKLYSSEKNRYLAIPFTDPGVMDQDGKYAKDKVRIALSSMVRQYSNLKEGIGRLSDRQIDENQQRLKESIENVRSLVNGQLLNKKALIAQGGSAKFDTSVIGTVSGHRMYGDEQDTFFSNIDAFGINLKEQGARRTAGKEYVDVGYAVLGNDVMHTWYDDKYFMGLTGGNKTLAEELKKNTYSHLHTHGTISMNARYPLNNERSVAGTMLYFDDIVHGDRMLMSEAQWLATHGDYDSDKANESLVRTDATIKVGQERIHKKIDYATYQSFKKMSETNNGISISLDDGEKVFDSVKADILTSAATSNINPVYDSEWDIGKGTLDISGKKTQGTMIDGIVPGNRKYTQDEHDLYTKKWIELEDETRKTIGADKFSSLGMGDRITEMTRYANSLEDKERNVMWEAMKHQKLMERKTIESLAVIGKNAAGPIDSTLYNLLTVAQWSGKYKGKELDAFAITRRALAESTLTSKSETEQDVTRVENVQKANSKLFRAMQTGKGIQDAQENFREVYRPLLEERAPKEIEQLTVPGLETSKQKIDYILDTISSLPNRVNLKNFSMEALKTGISDNNKSKERLVQLEGTEDMNQDFVSFIDEIARKQGASNGISRKMDIRAEAQDERYRNLKAIERDELDAKRMTENDTSGLTSLGGSPTARNAVRDAARRIKNIHLGKIGSGAVAIAGAALLSGFVSQPGGNSNTDPGPADEASYGAQQQQDVQAAEVPSFSDSNVNTQRGGPKSGYVININASSPNGQSAAQSAINGAISSLQPMTSSINMSMNTSYQDQISQLQLGRMIQQSIGMGG